MISRKFLLTLGGFFLPFAVLAHGEEVLLSLFYDLLTIIGLIVFITCIKWKPNGKLLLAIVLVVFVILAFMITANMPYTQNRVLIDTICIGVPILSVLGTFFTFRRKFLRS